MRSVSNYDCFIVTVSNRNVNEMDHKKTRILEQHVQICIS